MHTCTLCYKDHQAVITSDSQVEAYIKAWDEMDRRKEIKDLLRENKHFHKFGRNRVCENCSLHEIDYHFLYHEDIDKVCNNAKLSIL